MPVARRRYDITPAEMLDLARTAVDAVVAELHARTDQLVPDQLSRLEEVSASLAKTVTEVAESSYRSQMDSVRAGLDAVRDDLSGAMAEHDARLVQAVENRLAGYDPAELSRRLPPAVASAVIDGLENALPTIDKGLHEVRELVGELVERGKRSELSRQSSLDRLDEVLVELRAGLSENVTRQHAVLLEMLDERLSGLRLSELATELPSRIGTVISDAVQKSHDVQAESMQELASGLGRSLDAGLSRQRSATAELSATAERMAESVAGFSEVAEEAVTIAFERAQAAQAQRLNTMMRELRESQAEAVTELRVALETAVKELQTTQEASAVSLTRELDGRLTERIVEHAASLASDLEGRLGERFDSVVLPHQESLVEATTHLTEVVAGQAEGVVARLDAVAEDLDQVRVSTEAQRTAQESALSVATERIDRLAADAETQSSVHVSALAATRDELTAHLSELMETVSPRVSAELAAVLEETRTRHERVEGLIAELAWIVGEQRAGSAGIREDLARALEALPDAIASIQDASLRSEARITDLLARKLQGPDAR